MRKLTIDLMAMVLLGGVIANQALATPSTTYWTPCAIDIQPAGLIHITKDDYFSFGGSNPGEAFPTDLGLTWGKSLGSKIAAEYGFDVLTSAQHSWYFNAKIGYREGVLSPNAPAVQLGFFNFGTKSDVTNQNIVHLIVGKSLPNGKTRLHASYYVGNSSVLRSSGGDKENAGFMVAFDHQLVPGKWVVAGDYSSGKNAIGAGGIGIYYYFTNDISLLVGPVWFNDRGINGETKWTAQLDINM